MSLYRHRTWLCFLDCQCRLHVYYLDWIRAYQYEWL